MNSAPQIPAPSDWRKRRDAAQEACISLASRPDKEALAVVLAFALDPKWEVRKIVAEALASFPEGVAKEISGVIAGDTHAMVQAAIQRSLSRRQHGGDSHPGHEGLLYDEFEKIRARHGTEAAEAAREVAEKSTALHLRAAVHDIRNIITALNPSEELAADPAHKRNVNRIIKGRRYLKQMLDMMDRYSTPLTVKKTAVSFRDVIEESLASALLMIQEDGCDPSRVAVSIDFSGDLEFPASRFEIVMAFTNLIKNAIEAHGRKGTRINKGEVRIYCVYTDPFLEICVQDSGVGLSQTDLDDLMRFIPGNTSKKGGTGYGLPLCNRYITAHGGNLSLRSRDGEGTTAKVSIPFRFNPNKLRDELLELL